MTYCRGLPGKPFCTVYLPGHLLALKQAWLTIYSALPALDNQRRRMDYFSRRPFAALCSAYGAAGAVAAAPTLLPEYARQTLSPLLGVALAEDFHVLSPETLVSQNAELAETRAACSADWLVFAYSGQGDSWLLHKQQNETGFYDHNQEDYSRTSVRRLHLPLEGWVEVADLFRQFDVLNETTPEAFTQGYALQPAYKQDFVAQLATISPGLFERLPFTNV